MQYKRYQNKIIVRLDPNEELVEELGKVVDRESVLFAEISGLGGLNEICVSVFDISAKRYYDNTFCGALELIQLSGTATRKDGNPYLHLHASAGNEEGRVFGGHLKRAVVSVTAEIVLTVSDISIGREFCETIGINRISF